jgi:hypothetical protein
MAGERADGSGSAGRTAWARNLAAPVRDFLSTETGGAMALLVAAVVALLWANSPWSESYESLWSTELAITIGGGGIALDLREWVNEGLMTFFFLVVGLEAKRELDMGELRERRRLTIPAFAAIGGMSVPVAIFLAVNAGGPGAKGWGVAMSTDTAFALGALALLTPRAATRTRVFLLSLAVVDDLVALLVIATVYTDHVSLLPLAIACGFLGTLLALRYAPEGWRRPASIAAGLGLWVAMFESGIDPVISGLVIGLATSAYPPSRDDLERATELARSLREQPTPELARSAARGPLGDLAERAPAVRPASLDELHRRAALRAGQCRGAYDRCPARPRGDLADHAGHPHRLRRRQAGRHRRRVADRVAAGAARPALSAERPAARRGRGGRGRRLHDLAAHRDAGVHGAGARGGEARRACDRCRGAARRVGPPAHRPPAARRDARAPARGHGRRHPRRIAAGPAFR